MMQEARLSLELNQQFISAAVGTYIDHEVEKLARLKGYDDRATRIAKDSLRSNANDTFFWVSLVCHELEDPKVKARHTLDKLRAFPPGLDALYRRMLRHIPSSEDGPICLQILAVVPKVYRPITILELTSLVDLPASVFDPLKDVEEIIKLCGSFLIIREDTIYFVHQSAKDLLLEKANKEISSTTIEGQTKCMHCTFVSRSLKVMSDTLRTNIYGVASPGTPVKGLKEPEPKPLAATRLACSNWVKHLCDCDLGHLSGNDWLKYEGEILAFLREHPLHWIEALSLIGNFTDGVVAISSLEAKFSVSSSIISFKIKPG